MDNILVSTSGELRQPAKILRWLMEIGQVGRIHWAFTPGAANVFADLMSRLTPEHRKVQGEVEVGAGLPKTLEEAFRMVLSNPDVSISTSTPPG